MYNSLWTIAVEEKTGIAVLGIDIKALLLQAGVFLILFVIVKKFALRGIVDALEKRRLTIDKGVTLGLEMKAAKDKFDDELKKMHHEARLRADEILVEAQKEANAMLKESEAVATKKAEGILNDAAKHIEQEMEAARKSLRGEMLQLVSEATEAIIQEKIDAKKDASIIDKVLGKVRT
jgi:F-type H+-transporting ATPase subunit b